MVQDGAVTGMDVTEAEVRTKMKGTCDVCMEAKHVAGSHPESVSRAGVPLQRVHSDLMGPVRPVSQGGNEYVLTAIDDFSGYAEIAPLKHKSEAGDALKKILLRWERQLGRKVKIVRTDRGAEYTAFDRWCGSQGIMRERSVAYTPEQNGRAERFNRTLTQKARAMLLHARLAKKLWAETFVTASVVYNMSPRMKLSATPHELFWGERPDVRHLRTFGCKVFCQRLPQERQKLSSWSEEGQFVGYEAGSKGWRVLLPSGRIIVRYNVKFIEDEATGLGEESDDDQENDADAHHQAAEQIDPPEDEEIHSTEEQGPEEVDSVPEDAPPKKKVRFLLPRTRAPSQRLRDGYAHIASAHDGLPDDPSLEQALLQPDAELWRGARDEEMQSLIKLGVFEVVDKPDAVKLLKTKWVLKRKRTKEGLIERYKARLVAKGFTQRKGIDYDEVFASVVKHTTVRAMLAYAAVNDLEIEQIDVKTAFLNGPLEEDLFIDAPDGFDFGQGKVLKLKKALYGLKQAARAWHLELKRVLMMHGFKVSCADPCLFVMDRNGQQTFLLIYVDDGLIIGRMTEVTEVISILEKEFEIRKLGAAAYFLAMEIQRDREKKTIQISQKKYAESILQKTGMVTAKPKSIPMEANLKLSKEGDDTFADVTKYAETVGMLLYLSTCTRPDISHAVGLLARFMAKPLVRHWQCVKWLLQYLKKTTALGIQYGAKESLEFEGFSDADFAADPDKRRSTGGSVFMLAGGAVDWSSKFLPTVATSTMEAEYMAAAAAAKMALWLRKLMATMQDEGTQDMPGIELKCDNQAALALMHNPVHHQRAKHIDVCHHFLQERVARGEISIAFVPTKDMLADVMTKALAKPQFEKHRAKLGLVEICDDETGISVDTS
jgi:hypothetical protein